MLEITEPRTAEFLLDCDAVQPEFAHFLPKMSRKLVRSINFGGNWRDLVGGERTDCVANLIGHFAKIKIKTWSSDSGIIIHSSNEVIPAQPQSSL